MSSKGKGFNTMPVDTSKTRKSKSKSKPRESEAAAAPAAASMSADPEASVMPAYDFPIVYYLVNHDILTHSRNLNKYINMQTNACNRRQGDSDTHDFLSDANEMCVLFMHWQISHHLEKLKPTPAAYYATLNDIDFLNTHVLGHAKLVVDPPNLKIYNFCKHSLTIGPGASTAAARQHQFGPIGIAMFNALLTATSLLPANMAHVGFDTLWLGIDVANPEFEKVAKIYTVLGFSNPIITNMTSSHRPLGLTIMQLTRPLHKHASSHFDSIDNFKEAMSLWRQWQMPPHPPSEYVMDVRNVQSKIMTCKFSFDRSCILSLHLFPFISFNESGIATGISEMQKQRETSGKFVVVKHDVPDAAGYARVVYTLETMRDLTDQIIALKFTVGNVDSVPSAIGEATFHTHPIANYYREKAIIGPPSGDDFLSFVQIFIGLHYSGAGNQSYKFSLISTVEGIHIISLTPAGIHAFMNLMSSVLRRRQGNYTIAFPEFSTTVKRITDKYEYPPELRVFDWDQHTISENTSVEALDGPMNDYVGWFDEVNADNGEFFSWDWIPWKQLDIDYKIQVTYLENRVQILSP